MRIDQRIVYCDLETKARFLNLIYRYEIKGEIRSIVEDHKPMIEFSLPRNWSFRETKKFLSDFEEKFPDSNLAGYQLANAMQNVS